MTYISSESANALLSELRPTTLKAPALEYVNKFLDELLVKLVTEAQSINPEHLRLNGAPAVFVDRGKLGRDAVDDAEILIHDWYSDHPKAHSHFKVRELGFPPHGEGRGLVRSSDTFPVQQAIELMRLKVSMLSSFVESHPDQKMQDRVLAAWRTVGGDEAEETITPAGLWLTAILENVSEHILTKLSQVVSRDSSLTTANVKDLWVALCEDEGMYRLFQHMEVRRTLEAEVKQARPYRTASGSVTTIQAASSGATGSTSPVGSAHGSKSSLSSNGKRDSAVNGVPIARASTDHLFKATSKGSPSTSSASKTSHRRSTSVLSLSAKPTNDEFDALLRSGETMHISLTPSRFGTFESTRPTDGARKSAPPTAPSVESFAPLPPGLNGTHRQSIGRTWPPKLTPRAPIREEEENSEHGVSLPEVLKLEGHDRKSAAPVARGTPAIILGPPPVVDPPPRNESLEAKPAVPISEPSDSPRPAEQSLPRSMRSASEGGPFHDNLSFRRKAQRAELLQRDRDMVAFLQSAPPGHVDEPVPPRTRMPSFKHMTSSIVSRMKKDKQKEAERGPQLNGSTSSHGLRAFTPDRGTIRSQKSTSSFTNLVGFGVGNQAGHAKLPSDGGGSEGSPSSKVLLRKPSIVRKWTGDQQSTVRKPSSNGSSHPSSHPSQVEELDSNSSFASHGSDSTHQPNGSVASHASVAPFSNVSMSSHQPLTPTSAASVTMVTPTSNTFISSHQPPSPPRGGLGLGGVDFPSFEPIPEAEAPNVKTATMQFTRTATGGADKDATPKSKSADPMTSVATPTSIAEAPTPAVTSIPEGPAPTAEESVITQPASIVDSLKRYSGDSIAETFVSAQDKEVLEEDNGDKVHEMPTPDLATTNTTVSPNLALETPGLEAPELPTPFASKAASSTATLPPPEGYVAVSDLVSLRHLLDHATTARECQLLLDAILSQFGVPQTLAEATPIATAEDRVVAWLLAGREGPVGDVPPIVTPVKSPTHVRSASLPVTNGFANRFTHVKQPSITSEVTMKSLPELPAKIMDATTNIVDEVSQ